MNTHTRFVPQTYRDSVSLMQFSRRWKARPGIVEASATMATAANLALLKESGLLDAGWEPRPDDLLLILKGDAVSEADLDEAVAELKAPTASTGSGPSALEVPGSTVEAFGRDPELNFALISVPGDYAAAEALKALSQGLHVMLFSDNVSVEHEVFLKKEAQRRGLLMLGPDCGTALVRGVPLGFCNQVRNGPIGVVSASGTGLQEVISLLDRWGSGVSHALGTGGRDLKEAVGGLTALACLDLLDADPETKVVVLVSKPPAASVQSHLQARIARMTKPVFTCFLGDSTSVSLFEVARRAFAQAEGREPDTREPMGLPFQPRLPRAKGRWLRGLYSGGTLCAAAAFEAARRLGKVSSNVVAPGVSPLDDVWSSVGHTLVDLGEDEFTRGKPHPMIDQSLRLERLLREASDPETSALLVDVVLGHGSHPDQAGELAALVPNLRVPLFVSVTGTESDPQGWSRSLAVLRNAGAFAYGSGLEALEAALSFVPHPQEPS